ncbi:MAG: hypothetical protein ABIT96_07010 [Ferruginibacter sp.]
MKKLTIIALSMAAMISACKKTDVSPTPETTQQKILGSWALKTTISNEFNNGQNYRDTFYWPQGNTIDFKRNNKVYFYENGMSDSSTYGILTETKIWIEDPTEVYDITKLTAHEFQIYQKIINGTNQYVEGTVNMAR